MTVILELEVIKCRKFIKEVKKNTREKNWRLSLQRTERKYIRNKRNSNNGFV